MCVEIFRPYIVPKHYIIIQVDEMISQSGDMVQVTFDGRGAVRREVGVVWEDLLS